MVLALAVGGLTLSCASVAPFLVARNMVEASRLSDSGRYADAIEEAERAVALAESSFGSHHLFVARCLDFAGNLHRVQGNYPRAEQYLQRGLSIREAALGKTHLDVAISLDSLARLSIDRGSYRRAQVLLERALVIMEAAEGKSSPFLVRPLDNLATALQNQGFHERAEPLLQRALAITEATRGKQHPDVATLLGDLATLEMGRGIYERAEPLLQRALAINEATWGKAHPSVARSLNELGLLYTYQGLYGRAEAVFERALAIREATIDRRNGVPSDAFEMAVSLHNLALLSTKQGRLDRAKALQERALTIAEAALGKTHPGLARLLTHMGEIHIQRGALDQAEPILQRALAISEASLGATHQDLAYQLNNLALLYAEQGLYGRAEPLLKRALTLLEAAPGKLHPDAAKTLNNLANVYTEQGLYDRAGPIYERAIALEEAARGKAHPNLVLLLTNRAHLDIKRGLYRRAEPPLQRALAIAEAKLGPQHPDIAGPLTILAHLYLFQGLYDLAEPLLARALTIREAGLGQEHSMVAVSLNNLGWLYVQRGRYGQAERLYERALAIEQAAFGPSHPQVAVLATNLANLYLHQGLNDRAEPFLQRALEIREASLGKDHPDVAGSLSSLAVLYREQGQADRAEPLQLRALAIKEEHHEESHPEMATAVNGLALLRLQQGRLDEAVPLFTRALAITEGRLRQEALDFSESRREAFLQYLDETQEPLYALLRAHPGDPGVQRLALTAALLFKGRSAEETAATARTILRGLGAGDRGSFERLRELRTRFAKLSLDGPGKLSRAAHRKLLKEITREADALEADLARRSAPLRALAGLARPEEIVERVASMLPPDGALVEFVAYQDRRLVPAPGAPVEAHPRYLGLVLFRDGRILAADLGPAEPIDQAASRLRDALASKDARVQAAARELHRLAFRPLAPLLGDVRRLYVAPDGQLSLVPFAALHDGRRFLADTFDFTYLTTGRDLLSRAGDVPHPASVVVFANPDYSATRDGLDPALDVEPPAVASSERFDVDRGADLSPSQWVPLPGTDGERKAIQRFFPGTQVFQGRAATKARLLQLPAPGILHVATHGFFLEDAEDVKAPGGVRGLAHSGPLGMELPRPRDPLLRSGLVLAGAASAEDRGNSLVTALELSGLDLWGTELVVLSACDTGRGDVKRGQGIYGLRRALVVAGAETLVVSLWKVDDEVTRALMESYYRNLLAGQGRADALRSAMLSVRARHPHPHDWAPFIAIGSNAPLHRTRGGAP